MIYLSPQAWLSLLHLLFIGAPAAIVSGCLDLEEGYRLHGWSARVVGGLLLYSVGVWLVVAPIIALAGLTVRPEVTLFAFVSVLVSLVVALLIYVVCRRRHRRNEELDYDTTGDW